MAVPSSVDGGCQGRPFPDYPLDLLRARAAGITPTTVLTHSWSGIESNDELVDVPAHVAHMIPGPILTLLGPAPIRVRRNLHCVELCAGKGRINRFFEAMGCAGIALDKLYGDNMNLTTQAGLALAVGAVLRLMPGGLLCGGPQCSSWVWISRSSTKRSKDNPAGDVRRDSVREGNKLAVACALLANLCVTQSCHWLYENPVTSLFFDATPMKSAVAYALAVPFPVHNVTVSLGMYSAPTRKYVRLVGTPPWLPNMKRTLEGSKTGGTSESPVRTVKVVGKKVTGIKAALKMTEVYPVAFAKEIVYQYLGLSQQRAPAKKLSNTQGRKAAIQRTEEPTKKVRRGTDQEGPTRNARKKARK